MFKLFKAAQEYSDNKPRFIEFKKNELEFIDFQNNYDDFQTFLQYKDAFDKYKEVIGEGNKPFFLMYASDVDRDGNITFNYDFNPDFIVLLQQQGIQGIHEIEVIEAYLHLIFSQQYFSTMLSKKEEEKDK